MKKILIYLCTLFYFICGITSGGVFATTNYQVNIAVVCTDPGKGQELINLLCSRKSEIVYPASSKFVEENTEKSNNFTIIFDKLFDVNYHVKFHCMKSGSIDREIINRCSGVIILYDISDEALKPIVKSKTFYREDLKRLISELNGVSLIKDIEDFQRDVTQCCSCYSIFVDWLFPKYWYNAISFVTYNGDKLKHKTYKKYHERLSIFTCDLEKYYGVDNKWNRGHPDLSDQDAVCRNTLYWIAGQATRSIESGFVKNEYRESDYEKMPIKVSDA